MHSGGFRVPAKNGRINTNPTLTGTAAARKRGVTGRKPFLLDVAVPAGEQIDV
jgi:hypothetical protein